MLVFNKAAWTSISIEHLRVGSLVTETSESDKGAIWLCTAKYLYRLRKQHLPTCPPGAKV